MIWRFMAIMLVLAGLPVPRWAATAENVETKITLRNASVVMKLPSFPSARARVLQIVESHQGSLCNARTRVRSNGEQYGVW